VDCGTRCLSFKRISTLIVTDGEFVKRPAIEEAFSAALKSTDYESVLVYGQIGSGKTSFIRSALQGWRGVLVIISYFQKDCR
jgi:AAA+ ATPase superfamily predicted ATPase